MATIPQNSELLYSKSGLEKVGFNFKVNAEIVAKFETCKSKLIVKRGQVFLKFIDKDNTETLFDTSVSHEPSEVDLLQKSGDSSFRLVAKVRQKISASSLKRSNSEIKKSIRTLDLATNSASGAKKRGKVLKPVNDLKSKSSPSRRMLHLLALGPVTKAKLGSICKIDDYETIDKFFNTYADVLLANNAAFKEDTYFTLENMGKDYKLPQEYDAEKDDKFFYILKDSAYKYLDLWNWKYTEPQRSHVLKNMSNAFGRLNLPENDPVRARLTDPKVLQQRQKEQEQMKEEQRRKEFEEDQRKQERIRLQTAKELERKEKERKSNHSVSTGSSPLLSARNKRLASAGTSISNSSSITKSLSISPSLFKRSDETRKRKSEFMVSSDESDPERNVIATNAAATLSPQSSAAQGAEFQNKRKRTISSSSSGFTSSSSTNSSSSSRVSLHKRNKSSSSSPPSSSDLSPIDEKADRKYAMKQETPSKELLELAERFKSKYQEYEALYKYLEKQKSQYRGWKHGDEKIQKDVQRCVELHRELSEWKKIIWSGSSEAARKVKKSATLKRTGSANSSNSSNSNSNSTNNTHNKTSSYKPLSAVNSENHSNNHNQSHGHGHGHSHSHSHSHSNSNSNSNSHGNIHSPRVAGKPVPRHNGETGDASGASVSADRAKSSPHSRTPVSSSRYSPKVPHSAPALPKLPEKPIVKRTQRFSQNRGTMRTSNLFK